MTEAKYRIGFTGTRKGMTLAQAEKFAEIINSRPPDEFHHGLCIGADADAHNMIRDLVPECMVIGHPPTRTDKMAKLVVDKRRRPYWYTKRNGNIVNGTRYLIATPAGSVKQHRGSGTWQAIGIARRLIALNDFMNSKPHRLTIIYPNGSSISEGDL